MAPDPYAARCTAALEDALAAVPFYRRWRERDPGPARPLAERMAAMPVLSRMDLRAHVPHGFVRSGLSAHDGFAAGEIEIVTTSGTTADRAAVVWHQPWWDRSLREAARAHPALEAVYGGPHREAVLTSPMCTGNLCHVGELPMAERTLANLLFLNQELDPARWDAASVRRMADELNTFRPDVIEADPAYLAVLGRACLGSGTPLHQPACISLTYEFPSRLHVREIRRAFPGVPVVSSYGSTETGYVFTECEAGLLHQNTASCHVELQPVRAGRGGGRLGRILVTTLGNPWFGLLRFDVGDLARLHAGAPCRCGRTDGLTVEAIEGRVRDLTFDTRGVRRDRPAARRRDGDGGRPARLPGRAVGAAPVPGALRRRGRGGAHARRSAAAAPARRLRRRRGDRRAARAGARPRAVGEVQAGSHHVRVGRRGAVRVTSAHGPLDPLAHTRADFPLLERTIDGRPIVYLDSASTTPKPRCVIDAVVGAYTAHTANVHRGVHVLSEEATEAFEGARAEVASFLNASPAEIVFTRNSTEGVNLVAHGLGFGPGDEVVLTALEHHSNFLPWRVAARTVAVDLDADGMPRYDEVERLLSARTRLLALAQVSNTTGVVAPVEEWIAAAHARGLPALVDAAQSASHLPIDVRALDCDFLVLSGHKLLGPSGIGVLYGKRERLDALGLYQTGGGMVRRHGDDRFDAHDVPLRFEAGTPNIEGAIGLGAALAYLRGLGMDAVRAHSLALGRHLVEGLREIPGVRVVAGSTPLERRIGLATFTVEAAGLSQESLARLLCDRYQIIASGGYHCAHILHDRMKLAGTVRISTHVFNTHAEIERALEALREIAAW